MELTVTEAKSRIHHTLDGDQPGFECLGFHIRQYGVGKHHSGRHASGHRLGFKTLIKPGKANIQAHLAELGRLIRGSKALPEEVAITRQVKVQGNRSPYPDRLRPRCSRRMSWTGLLW
jgi:RNA-directed DNA polymerase